MTKIYMFEGEGGEYIEYIDCDGLKEVMGLKSFSVTDTSFRNSNGPVKPVDIDGNLYWPYRAVLSVIESLGLDVKGT